MRTSEQCFLRKWKKQHWQKISKLGCDTQELEFEWEKQLAHQRWRL
jgi:hypothetical protein